MKSDNKSQSRQHSSHWFNFVGGMIACAGLLGRGFTVYEVVVSESRVFVQFWGRDEFRTRENNKWISLCYRSTVLSTLSKTSAFMYIIYQAFTTTPTTSSYLRPLRPFIQKILIQSSSFFRIHSTPLPFPILQVLSDSVRIGRGLLSYRSSFKRLITLEVGSEVRGPCGDLGAVLGREILWLGCCMGCGAVEAISEVC